MRSLRGALFDDALDPAPSSEPPLRDRETGVDEQDFPGVLFWPGCTLSAYAPELTSVAYKALADANRVSAMTVRCCGNILRNIG
ncbi:MAG TPA: hypothetical protein DEB24_00985, partial [Coriobacteriia bacterium]|nr:hypothetical protein [Coriobacteriia bacterium]